MTSQSNFTVSKTSFGMSFATVTGANTAWTAPTNAGSDDANSATASVAAASRTNELHGDSLSFGPFMQATYPSQNLPAIALIDGIKVTVDRFGGAGLSDYSVYLTKNNGSSVAINVGDNKATGTAWPTTGGAANRATYGGSTDLWGTTWTAADVIDNKFGVSIAAQNTGGSTATANVQFVQITVYWHVGKQAGVTKRYMIKVYSRSGTYLGKLPEAASVFSLGQDINSAGSQITIQCPISIDTSRLQSTGSLQDETGADLQDEAGSSLLTEGAVPVVSVGLGSGLIRNGNRIIVIETSYWYSNGRVLFRGTIENWQAAIGEDDLVTILAYGDGSDLDWYPLIGPPYAATVDQSNSNRPVYLTASESIGPYTFFGQTFTVGAGVTNLGAIGLYLNGTAHVTVSVYATPASTAVLATTNQYISIANGDYIFAFPSHITVTPGSLLFFTVSVGSGESIQVAADNTASYATGAYYQQVYSGTGAVPAWSAVAGYDLYFKTYSTTGNTSASYLSLDPSTGMLKSFMDDYKTRGGQIAYTADSIDATGLTLSYNMKSNTVLEGIKAMLNLAPDGFYWYVEVSSNTLYFKNSSTTADVKLIKGRHINSINLTASIENVVNLYLFSGGEYDPAGHPGVNLYKTYQDTSSIALYGQRLDRRSDNRVILDATADAIGNSAIAQQKDEQFQTTVKLSDSTIDTAALHVGQIIGFAGFGTFVDSLLMQVVSVNYTPEETTLTLGILPKRATLHNERILRELIALQTIDNPSTPS